MLVLGLALVLKVFLRTNFRVLGLEPKVLGLGLGLGTWYLGLGLVFGNLDRILGLEVFSLALALNLTYSWCGIQAVRVIILCCMPYCLRPVSAEHNVHLCSYSSSSIPLH